MPLTLSKQNPVRGRRGRRTLVLSPSFFSGGGYSSRRSMCLFVCTYMCVRVCVCSARGSRITQQKYGTGWVRGSYRNSACFWSGGIVLLRPPACLLQTRLGVGGAGERVKVGRPVDHQRNEKKGVRCWSARTNVLHFSIYVCLYCHIPRLNEERHAFFVGSFVRSFVRPWCTGMVVGCLR